MKKFIFAFDGLKLSHKALLYALWLAKKESAYLAGISLESMFYDSSVPPGFTNDRVRSSELKRVRQADFETRSAAIANFESLCKQEYIDYAVHRDHYYAMQELLRESTYADLMVIDSRESMAPATERAPANFIRHLLEDAYCPLFVVKGNFATIQKVILLFDGSPAAVYAARMFNNVLPALNTLPLEILTINIPYASDDSHSHRLMRELMDRCYPNACRTLLRGRVAATIIGYLRKQTVHTLVVMGGCDTRPLQRLFHDKLANLLLREVTYPLLIISR